MNNLQIFPEYHATMHTKDGDDASAAAREALAKQQGCRFRLIC